MATATRGAARGWVPEGLAVMALVAQPGYLTSPPLALAAPAHRATRASGAHARLGRRQLAEARLATRSASSAVHRGGLHGRPLTAMAGLGTTAYAALAPLWHLCRRRIAHRPMRSGGHGGAEHTEATRARRPPVRLLAGLALGLGLCGPATFAGGLPFAFGLACIVFLVTREYSLLLDHILKPRPTPALGWALTAISLGTIMAAQLGVVTGIFESAAISLLVMLLVCQGRVKSDDGSTPVKFSHICAQVFGVFYCGYLTAFWIRLRMIRVPLPGAPSDALVHITSLLHWRLEPTVGACATTSCSLCIIAADTCAFLGGRKFGRHPLTPISPKKTVEGAYCGVIGSVLMALLCDWAWGLPTPLPIAALVGALISGASLMGDLVVSAMKRDAGVKDAGSLIPGHGGVLDRFDSYFFSAPVAYFCWYSYLKSKGSPLTRLVGAAWSGWAGGVVGL